MDLGNKARPHYHLCLFFNGNAYRSLGVFELGRPRPCRISLRLW
ncbi:inovirus-type Gp2 protein [Shewanella xiamenensis]|nr:inovirus-type Gp2 protein [Shewanella xiamenensis]MEE1982843.1 inovirus-type Gp2 protein [Shewanella xiamenensis]